MKNNKLEICEEGRTDTEFVRDLAVRMEMLGLSHNELARRSKVSQPAISRLLTGHHSPSLRTVERIAIALGYEARVRLTMLPQKKQKK